MKEIDYPKAIAEAGRITKELDKIVGYAGRLCQVVRMADPSDPAFDPELYFIRITYYENVFADCGLEIAALEKETLKKMREDKDGPWDGLLGRLGEMRLQERQAIDTLTQAGVELARKASLTPSDYSGCARSLRKLQDRVRAV